jgi:hypothetical protein
MTKKILSHEDSKTVRDTLTRAHDLARSIQQKEKELIVMLYRIDQQRFLQGMGINHFWAFAI